MHALLPFHHFGSRWMRLLAFAAAYAGAGLLGLAFRTEPEKFAIFWPPNGLLVGVLLVAKARYRLDYLVSGILVSLLVNLHAGDSFEVAAGFTAVNAAEALGISWLIARFCGDPFRMERTADVIAFYGCVLATCTVTGPLGACLVVYGLGAPDWVSAAIAFGLSDAMAITLIAPIIISWAGFDWRTLPRYAAKRWLEAGLVLAAMVGVALRVFDVVPGTVSPHRAYAFPPVPFILWAAVRFQTRGASAFLLVLSLISIWHTGHGRGPFCGPTISGTQRLLLVQMFLSIVSLTVLSMAGAINERLAIEERLRRSEERYRLVMETIQEVFWIASPSYDRFEYVSPAFDQVWRLPREQLTADPALFAASVHADDRDLSPVGSKTNATGFDSEYRIVRGDGAIRWIRTRAFPVFEGEHVSRVVGVSSDITDRKKAELANVKLIGELQSALAEIKTLRGLVPICAWCKDIRNDTGFWQKLEDYIQSHTEARFTHGICPTCLHKETTRITSDV